MMSTDLTKYVLIVEDEERVRTWMQKFLSTLRDEWQYLKAEHMKQAEEMAKKHWQDIILIVMDVMLPKDESDAENIKKLINERESAYDEWLKLEDEGLPRTDDKWSKARFAVDKFDRRIFRILNVEGGIELVANWAKIYGRDGKLDKCVLYLTARENEAVTEKGKALVALGKAEWRVKPLTSEEIRSAIKRMGLLE